MSDQQQFILHCEEMQPPTVTERTRFVVGVSGGKDSQGVLEWIVRDSGIPREQIIANFCDTENEHNWTYGHVEMLAREVHPIVTLRPERGFFDLALWKKRFPSTKARFCTEFLKIEPSRRFIEELIYQGLNPISVSGVRADESEERRELLEWGYSGTIGCIQWRPFIRKTAAEVIAISERHGIPLNPLYSIGAQRVGCWPCIMSRKAEIRTIALKFPERIDQIREMENTFESRYGRYSSFFPPNTVPPRFRTKPYQLGDGSWINIATIDDVVRWSLTGKGAEGSWENDEPEPVSCTSGYCE